MRFAIGTSIETLTELSDFDPPIPEPNHEFSLYAETVTAGDRTEFGLGLPGAIWVLALLEDTETYAPFKSICPGASASVYISTPNDLDEFTIYQATMVRPITRRPENGTWTVNLIIEFRDLVEVESS